eukprot:TRINITY_DN12098_c0_g1_i1.p1 TRINITY_DN12098_c0_g1~~TRINITY_DN12098_c0_g1_i1.p1  ORF type:complete len:203 (+),score=33.86 TRINITY_DN12098_c0_g1_i1:159-767(+)
MSLEEKMRQRKQQSDKHCSQDTRDSTAPPSEILAGFLYLGNEYNASSLEQLKQNKITHILNLTEDIPNFFHGNSEFTYMKMNLPDDERTYLPNSLSQMFDFLEKARGQSTRVLVHCRLGVSRSASVVIAYILKFQCDSLHEAMSLVRKTRPIVKPNPSFFKQLMDLEKKWKNLEKATVQVEDVWEKLPLSLWKYKYGEEDVF